MKMNIIALEHGTVTRGNYSQHEITIFKTFPRSSSRTRTYRVTQMIILLNDNHRELYFTRP